MAIINNLPQGNIVAKNGGSITFLRKDTDGNEVEVNEPYDIKFVIDDNATTVVPPVDGGTGLAEAPLKGDLLYGASKDSYARLPIGKNGEYLTVQNGMPTWGEMKTGDIGSVAKTDTIEDGSIVWGKGNKKAVVGLKSPIDCMFESNFTANRLSGLSPQAIQVEYTENGDSDTPTWISCNPADADELSILNKQKKQLTTGSDSQVDTKFCLYNKFISSSKKQIVQKNEADISDFSIKERYKTRLTFDIKNAGQGGQLYGIMKKIILHFSTCGSRSPAVMVEILKFNEETWKTIIQKETLLGWPGWAVLDVPSSYQDVGPKYITKIRFTFWHEGFKVENIDDNNIHDGFRIMRIGLYGPLWYNVTDKTNAIHPSFNFFAQYGTPYSYDEDYNITLPATLSLSTQGTTFSELFNSLKCINFKTGNKTKATINANSDGSLNISSNSTATGQGIFLTPKDGVPLTSNTFNATNTGDENRGMLISWDGNWSKNNFLPYKKAQTSTTAPDGQYSLSLGSAQYQWDKLYVSEINSGYKEGIVIPNCLAINDSLSVAKINITPQYAYNAFKKEYPDSSLTYEKFCEALGINDTTRIRILPASSYMAFGIPTAEAGSRTEDFLKYMILGTCEIYPNDTNTTYICNVTPSSRRILIFHIYQNAAKINDKNDKRYGLPQYCFGKTISYNATNNDTYFETFGTSNFTWYYKRYNYADFADKTKSNTFSKSVEFQDDLTAQFHNFIYTDQFNFVPSTYNKDHIDFNYRSGDKAHTELASPIKWYNFFSGQGTTLAGIKASNLILNKSSGTGGWSDGYGAIWFDDITSNSNSHMPVFDNNFTYNPYSGTLKVNNLTSTGTLTLKKNQYTDSLTTGALNMNNSNIYGINGLYFNDLFDDPSEGIHFYRDTTHVDSLWAKNGELYWSPNRTLGESGAKFEVLTTETVDYLKLEYKADISYSFVRQLSDMSLGVIPLTGSSSGTTLTSCTFNTDNLPDLTLYDDNAGDINSLYKYVKYLVNTDDLMPKLKIAVTDSSGVGSTEWIFDYIGGNTTSSATYKFSHIENKKETIITIANNSGTSPTVTTYTYS